MESRNPVIRRYADFQKPGSVLGNNQGTVITSTPVESSTKTFPGTTPAKPGERVVTMDDVVMKSFGMFALLLAGAFVGWNAPGLAIMAAIAGLFGVAIPFLLFNYASSLVPTKYSALALNAIPVVGIGFGALLGRGVPTPLQALGGLIVVVSLYVGTREK